MIGRKLLRPAHSLRLEMRTFLCSNYAAFGLLTVFAIFATGCTVGPRYGKPVTTIQLFHNAPSIQSRQAVLPAPHLDTWWTGFDDRELTRIVQRVLEQNLDLAQSLTRVEQARAAAKETGAKLKPSGSLTAQSDSFRQSLNGQFGRYAGDFPGYSRNQSYLDLGLEASWEIDLFGGLRRSAEAASAKAQVAEAEKLGVRVSVVAEVADAYIQIRGAQVRLNVAKEQIATGEHLLALVSQRRTAGVASDRELAPAQAVLSQAKATVPPLAIILEAQLNRLDVLMGAQAGTYAAELKTVRRFRMSHPGCRREFSPPFLMTNIQTSHFLFIRWRRPGCHFDPSRGKQRRCGRTCYTFLESRRWIYSASARRESMSSSLMLA
jgi:outer membrane protein TolC